MSLSYTQHYINNFGGVVLLTNDHNNDNQVSFIIVANAKVEYTKLKMLFYSYLILKKVKLVFTWNVMFFLTMMNTPDDVGSKSVYCTQKKLRSNTSVQSTFRPLKFTRRLISRDKHRKLDTTCWGLLTEKLLHLLHTHVNVEARDLVVVIVAVDA